MNAISLRSVLPLGLCSLLAAQAPPPLVLTAEDVLPASTYAVARFGGLGACSESAGAVPMAAVVNTFLAKVPAETRAQYFDHGLDQAADHVRQVLAKVGISPSDLRALLARPMVLAMGRLTVEGRGPSLALLIDAGESRAAFQRVMAAVVAQAKNEGMELVEEPVEIPGASVHRWRGPDELPSLFVGDVAGFCVLSNSRGYLRELAEVAAGHQPKLAAASGLGAAQHWLPAPALAAMFLNTRPLCAMFEPHMPYEATDYCRALGLGALDSIYLGTTASPAGGTDVAHLGLGGPVDGLCKALVAHPADLAFAQRCSKNTVLFAAGSLDVPGVVDAASSLMKLLPAGAAAEARRNLEHGLGRALAEHGSSLQELDGVLRSFGDQVGIAVALEKGAVPKPELLVRFAVRHPEHVAPLLQKLEAAVTENHHLEWKARQVGDATIRFCNVELPDAKFQLSPCYVLRNDELLFGSDVQALVRALKQSEKPEESFAAQPDFETLAHDCHGASGVLHLRLFRAAELGWRTVEQLGYSQLDAHKDEVGFGSETLPDQEAMAKALGTSTFLYQVDAHGFTVKSHGTLGLGSLLAALGAAADEVLHRACGKVY